MKTITSPHQGRKSRPSNIRVVMMTIRTEEAGIFCRRRKCGGQKPKMSGISWLTRCGFPSGSGGEKSLIAAKPSEEHDSKPIKEKKSFRAGVQEDSKYKVQKGHYEDLIETWRKTHSRPETGEFKTEKNQNRYVIGLKRMQIRLERHHPVQDRSRYLDVVVSEYLSQNMSGKGRKLTDGVGSTSRKAWSSWLFPCFKSGGSWIGYEAKKIKRQSYKAGEDNDVEEDEQQTSGDEQQSGGDYSEDEEGDNEEVQDESEESD
ncbi:hypothetical protein Tco_0242523 [Tanacetum coccineum]